MHATSGTTPRQAGGLTRLELLVTLSTLFLLAAVTLPLRGNPGPPRSLVCMENLRQLQTAWLLYAEDQHGQLPLNPTLSESANPVAGRAGWVSGVMSWDVAVYNTNTSYLIDARYATLAPYAGPDATLYRCPEDVYLSPQQAARGWTQRARSYVMNHFMGSATEFVLSHRYYRRLDDLQQLPPSRASVFLEEHPDSINDPMFIQNPAVTQWTDLPASFHEGSCWFTFADGHLERKKWQTPRLLIGIRYSFPTLPPIAPTDPDWTWLNARVSELR